MLTLTRLKRKYRNWMAADKKLRKLGVSLHYHLFRHRRWKGLASLDAKSKFTEIYRNNLWNNEESYSGGGSTLKRTSQIRSQLPTLLQARDIRSICDAGCGDFNWMKHVDLGQTMYIGVDIVRDMIEADQAVYGNERRRFIELDIVSEVIPKVDLILCRQCLYHLSLSDIHAALVNFKSSMSRYLLATHNPGVSINIDIITGGFRRLNWTLSPFNFPDPVLTLSEVQTDQCLALWRLEDIKSELFGPIHCAPTPLGKSSLLRP
jgi:SAM-dependent methyltransferase